MVNMITALCGYFSGTFVSDTGGTFKSDTPGTFVSDIGGTFEVILSTNGLCLNALHDKAFDNGLIAIRPEDYSLILSSELKQKKFLSPSFETNFIFYESKQIILPDKFLPSREFLDYHYNKIFKK